MVQTKVSLTPSLQDFLNGHKSYGFKDKSMMMRVALVRLKEELERESLERSADLYAEIYDQDKDSQALTESALEGWPE